MDSLLLERSMASDQYVPGRHDRTALAHVHHLRDRSRTTRPFIHLCSSFTTIEYNDSLLKPATMEKRIILISSLDLELGFVESSVHSSTAE